MLIPVIIGLSLLTLGIPPAPTARVSDYVGLLSAIGRRQLEDTLHKGERETGAQMVVAIFSSLEGEDLDDYSLRLANVWGVGRKGVDDGIVLVIFLKERKMRLAVGDGLRDAIPNAVAADILATIVRPRFGTGQHLLGLQEAARYIFQRIQSRQQRKGQEELPRIRPGA